MLGFYFNTQTQKLSYNLLGSILEQPIPIKVGNELPIRVTFSKNLSPRALVAPVTITLGVKTAVSDAEFVAVCETWTYDANSKSYNGVLDLNTVELIAALGEADEIRCVVDVRYSDASVGPVSSDTVDFIVERGVVTGDEGTPSHVPTPEEWLSARAVRYDEAQTLNSGEKAQAQSNMDAASGTAFAAHVGSGGSSHALVTTSVNGFMSASDKVKLNGVAAGATANQTDAYLLSRSNHTGTQSVATITGLGGAAILNVGTIAGTVAAGDDPRFSDVPSGSLAATIHAATSKTTPVDADEIPLADSAASWGLKKLTWANIKATLASVFLSRANNLSDLANASTSRTNLGLGDSATRNVGTTAGTVAAGDDPRFAGDTAFNAGIFTGELALDFANGGYQYGYMTGDTLFGAPSGGSEGDFLNISIRWVEGAYTLDFSGIKMNSEAQALLPITLEAWRCYLIQLVHIGGGWTLLDIKGPNTESVD